ncbi:aldo/keto reductase [Pannonibacter sp. Pt2-lr]|uniref:Aldo/keto reductase n=1 Tax=Pannonibacter anstelovis TaxID=3121537 RepID=A0ABU7ZQY3_9HYPH
MDQRRLGRTDIMVSSICLGTMTFGEQNTEAEGHAQLDYALDHGVNFFDTAEMYPIPPSGETQGRTERIIGTWLKARGNRDKIVLATKVAGRSDSTYYRKSGEEVRLTRPQIREAIERSLNNLQTDYVDLYQVHWPDRTVPGFGSNPTRWNDPAPAPDETPIAETLAALSELVKEGKVRHIGLSNESAWGTMTYLKLAETEGLARPVSIQNAYNMLNRTFETGLAEVSLREDVGLLGYSPLAQGALTGKYLDGALPAGSRKQLYNRLQRYEKPGAEEAIRAYVELARSAGMDPAQLAIAFPLTRSFMTSVIIGATSMAQLQVAIGAADVKLSPELIEKIDLLHQMHGNTSP